MTTLSDAWRGYNSSVMAYGQTGSGKSYCMMGPNPASFSQPGGSEREGIVPRLCRRLFQLADHCNSGARRDAAAGVEFVRVEVSYVELYNEEIRDLLNPGSGPLKLRETPATGVVVQVRLRVPPPVPACCPCARVRPS